MKQSKIILLIGGLITGFISSSSAQIMLPDFTVIAVRYKYLSAVDNKELPQPVRLLERKAVQYDIKNSELYADEYDEYDITFILPSGYILATYDKDGKLLRSAERYQDVALPATVVQAVGKKFPQWGFTKDLYLVTYHEANGAKKVWKITLQNGDMRLRVKADEKGNLIE